MSTTGYHFLDSVTDQVILFFGLIAAFVAGGAVIWLILRRASSSDDAVASTLRDSLQQIEAKLQEFEVAREKSHAGLKEQVASLASSELQLQKETSRLASALKSPGVRGR